MIALPQAFVRDRNADDPADHLVAQAVRQKTRVNRRRSLEWLVRRRNELFEFIASNRPELGGFHQPGSERRNVVLRFRSDEERSVLMLRLGPQSGFGVVDSSLAEPAAGRVLEHLFAKLIAPDKLDRREIGSLIGGQALAQIRKGVIDRPRVGEHFLARQRHRFAPDRVGQLLRCEPGFSARHFQQQRLVVGNLGESESKRLSAHILALATIRELQKKAFFAFGADHSPNDGALIAELNPVHGWVRRVFVARHASPPSRRRPRGKSLRHLPPSAAVRKDVRCPYSPPMVRLRRPRH